MTDQTTMTSYEIRPEGSSQLRGAFSDADRANEEAQREASRTGVAHLITEVVVTKDVRPFGRFEPA